MRTILIQAVDIVSVRGVSSTKNGNVVREVKDGEGRKWLTKPDASIGQYIGNYKRELATLILEEYRGDMRIVGAVTTFSEEGDLEEHTINHQADTPGCIFCRHNF